MNKLYNLVVGVVQPRPIAFVSSISRDGIRNLAPFSFFMAGGVNPPSIVYCPTLRGDGTPKDSLINVEETREFVINFVTRGMAEKMNLTGYDYPREVDEWIVSNFTPISSLKVMPERIKESPIQMECKLYEVVRHGISFGSAVYVIGEVVMIHIANDFMKEGEVDLSEFHPIARMGGTEYLDMKTREIFTLPRPKPQGPIES